MIPNKGVFNGSLLPMFRVFKSQLLAVECSIFTDLNFIPFKFAILYKICTACLSISGCQKWSFWLLPNIQKLPPGPCCRPPNIDLKPKHVLHVAIIYCIMNSHTPLCKNIDLQYIKEDEINKLGTCAYGGKIIGILAKEDNIKWGYIILFAGYMLTYKTYTSLYILASEYLFFLWKFEVCHK